MPFTKYHNQVSPYEFSNPLEINLKYHLVFLLLEIIKFLNLFVCLITQFFSNHLHHSKNFKLYQLMMKTCVNSFFYQLNF